MTDGTCNHIRQKGSIGDAAAQLDVELSAAEPEAMQSSSTQREPRSVAATGSSLAILAMVSGAQAVLFLRYFGTTERTDGFFAAYALYALVTVFAYTLRTSSVPLLTGPTPQMTFSRFAWAMAAMGAVILVGSAAFAEPLARLLGPGLSGAGQSVTADALRILGGGMFFQFCAGALATRLGIDGQLVRVAVAYSAGGVAALVVFLVLVGSTGVQSLAWSSLAVGSVAFVVMLSSRLRWPTRPGMRRQLSSGLPDPKKLLRDVGALGHSTAVPLAPGALYLATQALATRNSTSGQITLLYYAFQIVGYVGAATYVPLALSDMIALAPSREPRSLRVLRTVPRSFRYSLLVAIPALGTATIAAGPILHSLVPQKITATQVTTLQTLLVLLLGWVVADIMFHIVLPPLFSRGWSMRVTAVLPALVALHTGVSFVALEMAGVDGLVAAMGIALAVATLTAVGLQGKQARPVIDNLGKDTAWITACGILACGPSVGVVAAVTLALPVVGLAAVVSVLAYVALVSRRFPTESRVFLGLLRRT